MPISKFCATEFKPKWIGYLYTLRNPTDGYIFYVGKTHSKTTRYGAHLSESRSSTLYGKNKVKAKYIQDLLGRGLKPTMAIIEEHPIRTNYDEYYYDYREFYFIRKYLEYGWELTNVKVNDTLCSETRYKGIVAKAINGGELLPENFYYGLDYKDFPVYDQKKINSLGYFFSKEQFASHWAYLINLDKYIDIRETSLNYIYSDIACEENRNKNFDNYF